MATVLLSIGIVGVSVLGLAAGVLLGRAPIRGSCGGLGCSACGRCKREAR